MTQLQIDWYDGRSFAARSPASTWVHRCNGRRWSLAKPTIFRTLLDVQHGLTCAGCGFVQGVYAGSRSGYRVWGHACPDAQIGHVDIFSPALGALQLRGRRCGHQERVGFQ